MKNYYKPIGDYIRVVNEKNRDLSITNLRGVSINKKFIPSIANIVGTDLSSYKVVRMGQFAYGPITSRNGEKISIAYLDGDDCIISSSYTVFEVSKQKNLDPEYRMLWFSRPEFDRYARYKSHGSVREIFDWNELCMVEFPIPDIKEQKNIVKAYKTITDRITLKKQINDNLAKQCSVDYNLMLKGFTIDSDELPQGWSKGHIGDYCDVKSGFAFKSDWWTDGDVKVIKIANIVDNTIDLEGCDCISSGHAQKASNFFVKSGDILIAMTGATIGKIGIVPMCSDKIVVNQRVGKFFLGNNPIEKVPFLYATLLCRRVFRHLQPDGTAGSAQDNLSANNIKDIAIVIPKQTLINGFNQQHIPHIKTMMSNWAEIRQLRKIAGMILQIISSR